MMITVDLTHAHIYYIHTNIQIWFNHVNLSTIEYQQPTRVFKISKKIYHTGSDYYSKCKYFEKNPYKLRDSPPAMYLYSVQLKSMLLKKAVHGEISSS